MQLNLSSYGSQVLLSGDISVKDVISSSHYRVAQSASTTFDNNADLCSFHSAFVITDDPSAEVEEVTREVHMFQPGDNFGVYRTFCRRKSVGSSPSMDLTLDANPEKTSFFNKTTSATFSNGLSFNNNESAIYFGGSQTFRLMLEAGAPKRLVFQYLEPSTSMYVTKFSCAKE